MRTGPAKLTAQVHWIEVDPLYLEKLRRDLWIAGPLMVLGAVIIVAMQVFFPRASRAASGLPVAWLAPAIATAVALVALPLAMHLTRRWLAGYRIGVSTAGLHFEGAKSQWFFGTARRSGVVPWRDVHYDRRYMLARGTLLPLRPKGRWLFDEADINAWIVPNIARDNHALSGSLVLRGGAGVILVLAVVLAIAGAIIAVLTGSGRSL
jgi:hypothetical protein